MAAPAARRQRDLDRAALTGLEPDARRVRRADGVDAVREPDAEIEPLDARRRRELEPGAHLLSLECAVGVGLEPDLQPGPLGEREAGPEREEERRRQGHDLGPREQEPGEQP